jgi:hypothetical protein
LSTVAAARRALPHRVRIAWRTVPRTPRNRPPRVSASPSTELNTEVSFSLKVSGTVPFSISIGVRRQTDKSFIRFGEHRALQAAEAYRLIIHVMLPLNRTIVTRLGRLID